MVIHFPFNGQHKGVLPGVQPENTAPVMLNVRPFWKGRLRGGQRPGYEKWGEGTLIGGDNQPVVAICSVSTVD